MRRLVGLSFILCLGFSISRANNFECGGTLPKEHKTCSTSSDCVVLDRSCHCWLIINKKFISAHPPEGCMGSLGPGPQPKIDCIKGICSSTGEFEKKVSARGPGKSTMGGFADDPKEKARIMEIMNRKMNEKQ